jgi:hypothetical protein
MFALLLLAAATGFVPADKDSPDYSSFAAVISPQKVVLSDPGPAPAFDPAEYVPYRQAGNNVIAGSPTVTTSNGRTYICKQGDFVELYPSTAYTRWMLVKAVYRGYTENEFSDPARYVGAPAYLSFLSTDTIVREGDCQNGSFRIEGLPEGKYVMFAQIRIPGAGASIHTTTENGMGPGGEPATVFHNEVVGTTFPEDGWILLSGMFDLNRPQGTSYAPTTAWRVYAHISAGH